MHRTTANQRSAFTIIELLVVIATIGVIMAATAAGVGTLVRGNALNSGVNQMTSALSAARAVAMETGNDTGLVILANERQNLELQLVERDSASSDVRFVPLDGRRPDELPARIMTEGRNVLGLDVNGDTPAWIAPGGIVYDAAGSATPPTYPAGLLVWFGPDGTLKTEGASGSAYYDANDNDTEDAGEALAPIPFLVVYDSRDMQENMGTTFRDATLAEHTTWIETTGQTAGMVRTLAFNRYSGTLMRN